MTVTSLDNIRGSKSLVMEQQDEEDNSTANAVSFPASVLKQNSSTGKTWKQLLDLSMITTTALSKKGQRRGDTVCRLWMGATLRSWLMPIFLWLMAFIINSISNWVNFPGGRGGNSLWWPIQGGCARKGYFFQASGLSKGRGFTNWSIQKGREMSFGSVKGPKRANRLILWL